MVYSRLARLIDYPAIVDEKKKASLVRVNEQNEKEVTKVQDQ